MVHFEGNIVQFGFGAVGKSFYEKVRNELAFNENNYYVVTKYAGEFEPWVNMGGMVANFITCNVTKENFQTVFGKYLDSGDMLIDFADTMGTKDLCDWCAHRSIMYLNTGDADWPEEWLDVFKQHQYIAEIKKKYARRPQENERPIVLQHGNNPGLVSHFVKAGIEYIARTQYKKDKGLKACIKAGEFGRAAQRLGVKMIHVNDIDLQKMKATPAEDTLTNTWCVDSFLFELLTEAAINIGSHEEIAYADECKQLDFEKGYLEFQKLAVEKKCRTYYPGGAFEGYLVPHEETIGIAKSLEVRLPGKVVHRRGEKSKDYAALRGETVTDANSLEVRLPGKLEYRPSVMFLYSPCQSAVEYVNKARVNEYPKPDPAKPADCEKPGGQTIVRGHIYPKNAGIAYREHIESGTEYVGVLLMGERFNPVWVGNRVEPSFLYKHPKDSYWQTPTITPVAMSALAAVCWMVKNKEKGGIYLPDEIPDYKYILKFAEKYISKTICQTFEKETLEQALGINFSSLQSSEFFADAGG